MGNAIAKDNDTINWNNVKTDNFSESLGNKQLSNDSKLLLSKLNINLPDMPDTESENIDNIFTKYQSKSSSDDLNTTTSVENKIMNSGELSDTSPFISSEMYNYLVNKNQLGGNNKQKGGAKLDDDSSTSSTSSSSDDDSDSDKKKNKAKGKKKHETSESNSKSESENSDLSYVSSPGETEKSEDSEDSEESEQSNNSEDSDQSEELSGGSISNNNEDLPPSSINTSDINMISESS
jgi:hypothetical protein